MKLLQSLALLFFLCLVTASAKSRIGEYYLGLGYSIADSTSNDKEADFLRLTAHAPNGPDSHIGIYLDYGTMEQNDPMHPLGTWESIISLILTGLVDGSPV